MDYMFEGCTNLVSLNLNGWSLGWLDSKYFMFEGCSNLKTIYMKGCPQYTIDKIKDALSEANILDQVTIITN